MTSRGLPTVRNLSGLSGNLHCVSGNRNKVNPDSILYFEKLGMTLNSSVVVLSTTLNLCGAIEESALLQSAPLHSWFSFLVVPVSNKSLQRKPKGQIGRQWVKIMSMISLSRMYSLAENAWLINPILHKIYCPALQGLGSFSLRANSDPELNARDHD